MNTINFEQTRMILNKFIHSGINITPFVLNFLSSLEDPLEKVNSIIKESSFIPIFKGHLTEEILQKISNQEIQNALKRYLIKNPLIATDEELKNLNGIDILNEFKASSESPNTTRKSLSSGGETYNKLPENLPEENLINSELTEHKTPEKKEEYKISTTESSKSSLSFKPIAKEYNEEYEILKDPTGKLYTNGDYSDFYNLTVDKYNQLYNLIKKRGDTFSATNIGNILRNSIKQEVQTIGLIKEIRKTKNGNYFLTLEDTTGIINAIVKKDSEFQEMIQILERSLIDQIIFIGGTYNPPQKGNKGILYVTNLSKIDIMRDFEPNLSPDPLSIALISDTHIGSKEFMTDLWERFILFLNGKLGNSKVRELAGKVKYLIINGDLVDGIGVYPTQYEDLNIKDIYQQYEKAYELLSDIPEYIKIFYSSGNHEPVRNAIPRPAVPKKYAGALIDNGIKCIGNPAVIKTHNVSTLIFHGDSLIDLNQMIPGLNNENPVETMKELLICRHLAPVYGKKTQIAPTNKDWLVIDTIPDIFHTGHVHINGMGSYRNVSLVNSGCFQSRTEFMKSFGIEPTPGRVSLIDLKTLKGSEINLI